MFEKEAKEYRTHFENELYLFDNTDIFPNDIEEAYQKGTIDGYNKANEWHYVKDGDFPKENKKYWILTSSGEPKVDNWLSVSWVNSYDVIAWKEIVLPKEK